jgi:hypothetical protein
MSSGHLSVRGTLRWPVIGESVLLFLGVGALALEALLFSLLR